MDLLRFDDKDIGPVYIDGRALFLLTRSSEGDATRLGVVFTGQIAKDYDLAGDVDEVAASIERAVPGARIHRIV